jgi:hypothetical protein
MAQADGVVANGSGSAVRADINTQLAAVFTNHSGATQPSDIQQHQFWYDESANILKIRNDGDTDWVNLIDFTSGAEGAVHVPLGSTSLTAIRPGDDNDSGFIFAKDSTNNHHGFSFVSGGTEWLRFNPSTTNPNPTLNWKTSVTSNIASYSTQSTAADGVQFVQSGGAAFARYGAQPVTINRVDSNGGALIAFNKEGTNTGNISVSSGGAVTLVGAHLSRWSQLPGGNARAEILKGTILTNLDEMCEWSDEDNEQLNRMQVSSVEGDVNVSGVFQSWDDDDDTYTNDFYCAMTGDFVIRIAQGTTVARGDLLMSAGDGTAKPQGDDIVRSKTVAKVTSTIVSETYDDGSYCVPCVLMAC